MLFATDTGKLNTSLDAMLHRLLKQDRARTCAPLPGHVRRPLLRTGADLYDVPRLLGITAGVTEQHYGPYAPELQERIRRLVSKLDFVELADNASAASYK